MSDTITRIRNAQISRHKSVIVRNTKLILNVLQIFLSEGYINAINNIYINNKNYIQVVLKYNNESRPLVNELKMISKPSKSVYRKFKEIYAINNNLGLIVLSSSLGILSHKNAKKLKVGGKIICKIF